MTSIYDSYIAREKMRKEQLPFLDMSDDSRQHVDGHVSDLFKWYQGRLLEMLPYCQLHNWHVDTGGGGGG